MHLDNSQLNTYILINLDLKPSYSFVKKVKLTEHEASIKNMSFGLNSVRKKYILEKDWN